MDTTRTKSIKNLEEKMEGASGDALRCQVLKSAKDFKTSWIGLGQTLYTVWKDKSYKGWGYNSFDAYTSKEIGIRKQTALKLLRSYFFLEKEEPLYLKKDYDGKSVASAPSYESIDVLRLAGNKKEIDKSDYEQMKRNVLEKGKDGREVKKDLTALIKQRQELLPEEAWQKKRLGLLRRFLSLLKSIREEIRLAKILPVQIVKDVDKLIAKLESEMPVQR